MKNFIDDHIVGVAAVSLAALAVVGMGGFTAYVHSTQRTVTAKVTKTWVQNTKDGSINLIGTDKGVFEDQDSVTYLKFNSSDFYNEMTPGKTYTFDVTGWRIPLLSVWPNIVSCEDCSN